jgi:hypothetical protein
MALKVASGIAPINRFVLRDKDWRSGLDRSGAAGWQGERMSGDERQAFYDDVTALRSERLRNFHRQWAECCAGAPYPGLAAIDPLQLKPFLADLVLVDVGDPDDPVFRLVGGGFNDFFRRPFKGEKVRNAAFPEREMIAASYRQVAASGRPLLGWYRWRSEEGVPYHSEFVVLPYGDGRVERLLVMEDLDPARHGTTEAPA